ncbi:hypothetical protein BH11MYX2_BH11MYX2_25940 [soil metagenome]
MALAAAEKVPAHPYKEFSANSPSCRECGWDASSIPELHERGQLLPGELDEAILALEHAEKEAPPVATKADVKRLSDLLALVGTLLDTAREGALNEAIRKAKLVVGNKYDIRHVIETLGACGILETPEHPGFTTAWTSFAARQDRPSVRVECDPPIAFWIAAHGVNAKNVTQWFGALGVKAPAGTRARKLPVAKMSSSAKRREARAARNTELVVGDIVQIGKRSAIVVGHHHDRGGRFPILQPWDNALVGRPAMMDMWKRDDPKGRWTTVGTAGITPVTTGYTLCRIGRDGAGLAQLFR